MGFNLNNYETVKSRKKRFYEKYPNGRIIVREVGNKVLEFAHFFCEIYRDNENIIASTGNALELRELDKLKSRSGQSYESVNYSSWLENAEESAVGRALDNLGFSGNDKCSREEMLKASKKNLTPEKPLITTEQFNKYKNDANGVENIEILNELGINILKFELTPGQLAESKKIYFENKKRIEDNCK